jgi:Ran GTPase-activating protein (RanGAP) involved in mRNA processing and transport
MTSVRDKGYTTKEEGQMAALQELYSLALNAECQSSWFLPKSDGAYAPPPEQDQLPARWLCEMNRASPFLGFAAHLVTVVCAFEQWKRTRSNVFARGHANDPQALLCQELKSWLTHEVCRFEAYDQTVLDMLHLRQRYVSKIAADDVIIDGNERLSELICTVSHHLERLVAYADRQVALLSCATGLNVLQKHSRRVVAFTALYLLHIFPPGDDDDDGDGADAASRVAGGASGDAEVDALVHVGGVETSIINEALSVGDDVLITNIRMSIANLWKQSGGGSVDGDDDDDAAGDDDGNDAQNRISVSLQALHALLNTPVFLHLFPRDSSGDGADTAFDDDDDLCELPNPCLNSKGRKKMPKQLGGVHLLRILAENKDTSANQRLLMSLAEILGLLHELARLTLFIARGIRHVRTSMSEHASDGGSQLGFDLLALDNASPMLLKLVTTHSTVCSTLSASLSDFLTSVKERFDRILRRKFSAKEIRHRVLISTEGNRSEARHKVTLQQRQEKEFYSTCGSNLDSLYARIKRETAVCGTRANQLNEHMNRILHNDTAGEDIVLEADLAAVLLNSAHGSDGIVITAGDESTVLAADARRKALQACVRGAKRYVSHIDMACRCAQLYMTAEETTKKLVTLSKRALLLQRKRDVARQTLVDERLAALRLAREDRRRAQVRAQKARDARAELRTKKKAQLQQQIDQAALVFVNESNQGHDDKSIGKVCAHIEEYASIIKYVDVSHNRLTAEGVKMLVAAAAKCSQLQRFVLQGNPLGDQGVIHVCELLAVKGSNLIFIDIGNCSITHVGTFKIAAVIKHNTVLRRLWCGNNSITDMGVIALVQALRTNLTLWQLGLQRIAFGVKAITALTSMYATGARAVQTEVDGASAPAPLQVLFSSASSFATASGAPTVSDRELKGAMMQSASHLSAEQLHAGDVKAVEVEALTSSDEENDEGGDEPSALRAAQGSGGAAEAFRNAAMASLASRPSISQQLTRVDDEPYTASECDQIKVVHATYMSTLGSKTNTGKKKAPIPAQLEVTKKQIGDLKDGGDGDGDGDGGDDGEEMDMSAFLDGMNDDDDDDGNGGDKGNEGVLAAGYTEVRPKHPPSSVEMLPLTWICRMNEMGDGQSGDAEPWDELSVTARQCVNDICQYLRGRMLGLRFARIIRLKGVGDDDASDSDGDDSDHMEEVEEVIAEEGMNDPLALFLHEVNSWISRELCTYACTRTSIAQLRARLLYLFKVRTSEIFASSALPRVLYRVENRLDEQVISGLRQLTMRREAGYWKALASHTKSFTEHCLHLLLVVFWDHPEHLRRALTVQRDAEQQSLQEAGNAAADDSAKAASNDQRNVLPVYSVLSLYDTAELLRNDVSLGANGSADAPVKLGNGIVGFKGYNAAEGVNGNGGDAASAANSSVSSDTATVQKMLLRFLGSHVGKSLRTLAESPFISKMSPSTSLVSPTMSHSTFVGTGGASDDDDDDGDGDGDAAFEIMLAGVEDDGDVERLRKRRAAQQLNAARAKAADEEEWAFWAAHGTDNAFLTASGLSHVPAAVLPPNDEGTDGVVSSDDESQTFARRLAPLVSSHVSGVPSQLSDDPLLQDTYFRLIGLVSELGKSYVLCKRTQEYGTGAGLPILSTVESKIELVKLLTLHTNICMAISDDVEMLDELLQELYVSDTPLPDYSAPERASPDAPTEKKGFFARAKEAASEKLKEKRAELEKKKNLLVDGVSAESNVFVPCSKFLIDRLRNERVRVQKSSFMLKRLVQERDNADDDDVDVAAAASGDAATQTKRNRLATRAAKLVALMPSLVTSMNARIPGKHAVNTTKIDEQVRELDELRRSDAQQDDVHAQYLHMRAEKAAAAKTAAAASNDAAAAGAVHRGGGGSSGGDAARKAIAQTATVAATAAAAGDGDALLYAQIREYCANAWSESIRATALDSAHTQSMSLTSSRVNDDECAQLSKKIQRDDGVTLLNLKDNSITWVGAEALFASCVQCTTLTHLIVSGNNIGDGGVRSLVPLLAASILQLQYLDVSDNNIGDSFVDLARALEHNASLTSLNASHNRDIGDAGACALVDAVAFSAHTALADLHVNEIGMSATGGAALLQLSMSSTTLLHVAMNHNPLVPAPLHHRIVGVLRGHRAAFQAFDDEQQRQIRRLRDTILSEESTVKYCSNVLPILLRDIAREFMTSESGGGGGGGGGDVATICDDVTSALALHECRPGQGPLLWSATRCRELAALAAERAANAGERSAQQQRVNAARLKAEERRRKADDKVRREAEKIAEKERQEQQLREKRANVPLHKAGYLMKAGSKGKSWKKRYIVLHDYTLKYYRVEGDAKPLGEVPILEDARVRVHYEKAHTLAISSPSMQRVFLLTGDDDAVRNAWMASLKANVATLKGDGDSYIPAAAFMSRGSRQGKGLLEDAAAAPASPSPSPSPSSSSSSSSSAAAASASGEVVSAASLKEGYIRKKGASALASWQMRYFVLLPGIFQYFKRKEDKQPAGEVHITAFSCVNATPKNKFGFGIFSRGGAFEGMNAKKAARTYELSALNDEDRSDWISTIQLMIDTIKLEAELERGPEAVNDAANGDGDAGEEDMSSVTPVRQGYLKKVGGQVKSWKTRYFFLVPGWLRYYRAATDRYSAGKVALLPDTVVEATNGGKPHTFTVVVTQPSPRTYMMQANNDEDMNLWIAAITSVVKEQKRRPSAVLKEKDGNLLKQTLRPFARRVMNVNATAKRQSVMVMASSSAASSADKRLFTKVNHMSQWEGYMEKKGAKVGKAFQKRYFILHVGKLTYFGKKGDTLAAGVIPVTNATLVRPDPRPGQVLKFSIGIRGGTGRTYYLKALSEHDKDACIEALNKQISSIAVEHKVNRCSVSLTSAGALSLAQFAGMSGDDGSDEDASADDGGFSSGDEGDSDEVVDEEKEEDIEFDCDADDYKSVVAMPFAPQVDDADSSAVRRYVYLRAFPLMVRRAITMVEEDEFKLAHSYRALGELANVVVMRAQMLSIVCERVDVQSNDSRLAASVDSLRAWFKVLLLSAPKLVAQLDVNIRDTLTLAEEEPTLLQKTLRIVNVEDTAGSSDATAKAELGARFKLLSGMHGIRKRVFELFSTATTTTASEASIVARYLDAPIDVSIEEGNCQKALTIARIDESIVERITDLCPYMDFRRSTLDHEQLDVDQMLGDLKAFVDDLMIVEDEAVALFPTDFGIMKLYVNRYHQRIGKLFSTISRSKLNVAELLSVVKWAQWYDDYMHDEFSKKVHMKTHIGGFMDEYIQKSKDKVLSWVDSILTNEQAMTDVTSESGDGMYLTHGPSDLFTQINMMMDMIAQYELVGEAWMRIGMMCAGILNYYYQSFGAFLDGDGGVASAELDINSFTAAAAAAATATGDRDPGTVMLGSVKKSHAYLIAQVNNYRQFHSCTEQLKSVFCDKFGDEEEDAARRGQVEDLFEDADEGFAGLAEQCIEILAHDVVSRVAAPLCAVFLGDGGCDEAAGLAKWLDEEADSDNAPALNLTDAIDKALEGITQFIDADAFFNKLVQKLVRRLSTAYVRVFLERVASPGYIDVYKSSANRRCFVRMKEDRDRFVEYFESLTDCLGEKDLLPLKVLLDVKAVMLCQPSDMHKFFGGIVDSFWTGADAGALNGDSGSDDAGSWAPADVIKVLLRLKPNVDPLVAQQVHATFVAHVRQWRRKQRGEDEDEIVDDGDAAGNSGGGGGGGDVKARMRLKYERMKARKEMGLGVFGKTRS